MSTEIKGVFQDRQVLQLFIKRASKGIGGVTEKEIRDTCRARATETPWKGLLWG